MGTPARPQFERFLSGRAGVPVLHGNHPEPLYAFRVILPTEFLRNVCCEGKLRRN